MPLQRGDNPRAIAHNIRTEKSAGKKQSQAVAIALHTAKDSEERVFTPHDVDPSCKLPRKEGDKFTVRGISYTTTRIYDNRIRATRDSSTVDRSFRVGDRLVVHVHR